MTILTGAGKTATSLTAVSRVRLVTVPLGRYWAAHASRAFLLAVQSEARRHDLLHDHGLWLFTNWASEWAARRTGRPWVVSPRGTLAPWALSRSRLRKWVAWRVFQGAALRRAARIHATSVGEAQAVSRVLREAQICVTPNGVDLEGEFPCRAAHRSTAVPREVRFLGRIHPVKGLDTLLAAWRLLTSCDARLTIAGSGEPKYVWDLENAIAALGLGGEVRYVGPVAREARAEWLGEAHVVVLPSHSENYGMVVAEALACGTPVITTTGTPWSEVRASNCGWWVPPTAAGIASALREALALSPGRRLEMGERGRRLVEERHSSSAAAARMEEMYRQVLEERGSSRSLGSSRG